MREIVDLATVDKVILGLGAAWLVGSLVVGGLRLKRAASRKATAKALVVASLGPVLIGLWKLYLYLVRFDPRTGYFGLVSVKILLLCLVIFLGIGVIYGRCLSALSEPGA